ncbi:MAG: DUF1572 family protein [Saprospiraceae bacterium]|nr:DUF1572 family protein [Candidatus Vicinibacter affinis]MBK7695938.1 DUF1572 family protein [Candidatus Vicinibacter affinis]MBK9640526.1 DUF1572 family protein [Candidatus Vicinibacter affinis]
MHAVLNAQELKFINQGSAIDNLKKINILSPILALIKAEFNQRINSESKKRILQCLNELEAEQLTWKPNPSTNSTANLILHLCGNMRQYIIAGLGKQIDVRERSKEFSNNGPFTHEHLQTLLEQTTQQATEIVAQLKDENLYEIFHIQCFDLSGYEVISHVIEHFSYHTGQIALLCKIIKNKDLGFYKEMDLEN